MKKNFLAIITAAISLGIIGSTNSGCTFKNEEDHYANIGCDTTSVTYASTIAPIFNQSCTSCHSGGGGSLPYLDNHADIADYLGQKPTELQARINHEPGFAAMPQGGSKMPVCDIRKIEIWIAEGYLNN